jgi:G:T-mismatch repair DNA endonuclease (very short patch repair protein)
MCKFNKSERKLYSIIRQVAPNQYRYNGTGDLGLRIFRHLPDFINVDGQKKIIELYGCYWHCCPVCGITKTPFRDAEDIHAKDAMTMRHMEALGYKVLVVWTHEFRNLNEVAQLQERIREFNEK